MSPSPQVRSQPGRLATAMTLVLALAAAACGRDAGSDVETAEIARGDYTDVLELRGEVRPVRTTFVMAPRNAGTLLILKLARSGTEVKAGDVVVEFDAVSIRNTIRQKQSELRSAEAERKQAEAQAAITREEQAAAVRRAAFDVERAELALGDVELVSQIEAERRRLALVDAEHRLLEARAGERATLAGLASDETARAQRAAKIQADLDRATRAVEALAVTAPTDGTVSVMTNTRSGPMLSTGSRQEYRTGDTTYSGATVLELPDLSSVFLLARLDEADRGVLQVGQRAVVRADAIPDRDYPAAVTDISLLARTEFTGSWPPPKLFDLTITIDESDGRLRPGMSATARIDVGRIPDVLLAPTEAVFTVEGRPVVYLQRGRDFVPVPVTVRRQGREVTVVEGDVAAGDRIALRRPDLAGDTGEEAGR